MLHSDGFLVIYDGNFSSWINRFLVVEKRMAEMMMIMQSLGQATGVLVQLSAPPLPTPTTTPVSMKVHFSLVLCLCDIKPS
jgi:hypothetical protein